MVSGRVRSVAVIVMARRIAMATACASQVRRSTKTISVTGSQRSWQKGQIIGKSHSCSGSCGLIVGDLLLLELSDEMLGRMEIFARLS